MNSRARVQSRVLLPLRVLSPPSPAPRSRRARGGGGVVRTEDRGERGCPGSRRGRLTGTQIPRDGGSPARPGVRAAAALPRHRPVLSCPVLSCPDDSCGSLESSSKSRPTRLSDRRRSRGFSRGWLPPVSTREHACVWDVCVVLRRAAARLPSARVSPEPVAQVFTGPCLVCQPRHMVRAPPAASGDLPVPQRLERGPLSGTVVQGAECR